MQDPTFPDAFGNQGHRILGMPHQCEYADEACPAPCIVDAVEFVQPKGGLFMWVKLTGARGQESNANELAKRAIAEGVAFVPGAPFFSQNPDVSTLRLSFATADVDKIREGIARLKKALAA